jgi:hypothetical protein
MSGAAGRAITPPLAIEARRIATCSGKATGTVAHPAGRICVPPLHPSFSAMASGQAAAP